jgi:DNA-binding transcriptional LysR family regulator
MTDRRKHAATIGRWAPGPSPMLPGSDGGGPRMELRQLRYFVTLAEELHFGRAAAREHIVQSALSQQVQRLERALGVRLLERTTRRIWLTPAGSRFLIEARQVLAHVDRAAMVAQHAGSAAPTLRVAVTDESYESMRQILPEVQLRYPDLEIHQVQVGVPDQMRLLADGRLDVGMGRASAAPSEVASELVRLDPLGVVVPEDHPFAATAAVAVAALRDEPLLLADEQRAPEFNEFVTELCRSVGALPRLYKGTVQSLRAAMDLVQQRRCVLCVPASCASTGSGVVWRPLTAPGARYPWSILWRASDRSPQVRALVACARTRSRMDGWLESAIRSAS